MRPINVLFDMVVKLGVCLNQVCLLYTLQTLCKMQQSEINLAIVRRIKNYETSDSLVSTSHLFQ